MAPLSKRTKDAVENNEKIEDLSVRKKVRMEIKHQMVDVLIKESGTVKRPLIAQVRTLCVDLGHIYSNMFHNTEDKGYGLGGNAGIDGLAEQILADIRRKDGKKMTITHREETGREKIYGVDEVRFKPGAKEIKDDLVAELEEAGKKDLSFEEREKCYNKCRTELQFIFRSSKQSIPMQVPKYWMDRRFNSSHFSFLTKSNALLETVEKNLENQIKCCELWMMHMSGDSNFATKMADVSNKCDVEYGGSTNLLKIFIMRELATKIDKDGSKLLRMESDNDPPGNEAHVFCQDSDDGFKFQVWVDGSALLINLSLAEAIASFIELCFTHNLKYPKVS